MRRFYVAGLVACLLMATSVPALAVPASNQNKQVYVFTEEDALGEAAAVTAECGFPIDVTITGWVQTKSFRAGGGDRQQASIDVYHSDIIYTTGDRSFAIHDVGPDHHYWLDGVLYVAITGRSLTGSGVIGHVIVNTETGELVFQAGNDQGFYRTNVCAALS